MSKNKQFYGIDISKDVFDVVDPLEHHHQFLNDASGFKEFGKILTENSHCVMEVTGAITRAWLRCCTKDQLVSQW